MRRFLPRYDNIRSSEDYDRVPVIIVGLVQEKATPAGDVRPASFDKQLLTQRYRTKVRIENVLQGEDLTVGAVVNIYFFVDSANMGTSGVPISFIPGERDIILLQRDSGELRTIADKFSNWCVIPVLSGSHPNFVADPSKPAIKNMTEVLLTRGEGATNSQMRAAIEYVAGRLAYLEPFSIPKLQQIAKEDAALREQACRSLEQLDKPCVTNPGAKG